MSDLKSITIGGVSLPVVLGQKDWAWFQIYFQGFEKYTDVPAADFYERLGGKIPEAKAKKIKEV
jgi:hypothetical protein